MTFAKPVYRSANSHAVPVKYVEFISDWVDFGNILENICLFKNPPISRAAMIGAVIEALI